MGKNLILAFKKLKYENKKQFNLQNNNNVNNDLKIDLNSKRDETLNKKTYKIEVKEDLIFDKLDWEKLIEDFKNIENDNYWENGFYLGYNKYEKKLPIKEDKNMYLVIKDKDSDSIKDHYKITDLISKNTDYEEKENFWYKFGLEQHWTGYCWSSGIIDYIKDIDEYLDKKFKELQEKPWNEIIKNYVEDKFGYTVVNNLFDINWEKQSDKNIELIR